MQFSANIFVEDTSSPFGIHFSTALIKGDLIIHFVAHRDDGSKIQSVLD